MILLPSSILALIYAFTTINAAITHEEFSSANISLSSELENIVPACAQICFISFLEANFPTSICTTRPTLECLCSQHSVSGYTVGEGAVQCIVSEGNIGYCQEESGTDTIVQDAYNMCVGVSNALPNTHATLTATLVLATGSPSIVNIAPSTSTTVQTTLQTTLSTSRTSIARSTSTSASSSSSLLPSQTATTSTTAIIGPSTTALSSQTQAAAVVEATPLSKAQISGIAVGSVGGVALVIVALLLCARQRRRLLAKRDRDSNPFPFQMEPEKPVNTGLHGFVGPNEQWNGNDGKPTPTVPPRALTDPNMFARSSRYEQGPSASGAIGIAISPETRQNQESAQRWQQRSSKLLPEKPTLKLQVPPVSRLPLRPPPRFPLLPSVLPKAAETYQSRDSGLTQFEEDPNTPYRYSAADQDVFLDTGSQERILRPEQREEWRQSPGSLAVPQPLKIRKSQQPPPRQNYSQLHPALSTAASSVYSRRQSFTPTDVDKEMPIHAGWRPQKAPLNPYNPYVPWQPPSDWQTEVTPYPTQEKPQRPLRPEQSKRYSKPMPRQRSESMDSATSIESQAADYMPRTPDTRHLDVNLSPVAESPRAGKSPVTYPEIPGREPAPTIRVVQPPPPQPVFTPTPAQGRRRSQIEIARQHYQQQQQNQQLQQRQRQPQNNQSDQPWRVAEIEQARARSQAAVAASQKGLSQTQGIPNYPNGPHRGSRAIGNTMTTQPGQQSRLRSNSGNVRPTLPQLNTDFNVNARSSPPPPRLPLKVNPPTNGTGLTQPPTIRQVQPSGAQSKAFHAIYPEPQRASGISQASGSDTSSLAARRARTPVALQLFGQGSKGTQWKRAGGDRTGEPMTPVTAGPDGPLSPGMHLTPKAVGDDLFLLVI